MNRRQVVTLENDALGRPDVDHDRASERRFVPAGGLADIEATLNQLGL